jgi:hypothetical protein
MSADEASGAAGAAAAASSRWVHRGPAVARRAGSCGRGVSPVPLPPSRPTRSAPPNERSAAKKGGKKRRKQVPDAELTPEELERRQRQRARREVALKQRQEGERQPGWHLARAALPRISRGTRAGRLAGCKLTPPPPLHPPAPTCPTAARMAPPPPTHTHPSPARCAPPQAKPTRRSGSGARATSTVSAPRRRRSPRIAPRGPRRSACAARPPPTWTWWWCPSSGTPRWGSSGPGPGRGGPCREALRAAAAAVGPPPG